MKNSPATVNLQTPASGRIYYSNMIGKTAPGIIGKSIYLYRLADAGKRFFIVANAEENERGRIVVFNAAGELLNSQKIVIYKGKNTIEVSGIGSPDAKPRLIAVYLNEQLAFMQKLS